jgi:hypothetical protein
LHILGQPNAFLAKATARGAGAVEGEDGRELLGISGGEGSALAAARGSGGGGQAEAEAGGGEEPVPPGRSELWLHVGLTVGMLCGSWAVATLVRDLGVVLSVVGATGSTLVSYILPGACYARLHPEPTCERAAAMAMLGLGCVIGPAALVVIFL